MLTLVEHKIKTVRKNEKFMWSILVLTCIFDI